MKPRGKLLHLVIVVILLIAGVAVVATLRRPYIAESTRGVLEREISRRIGADVRIGRVRGSIFREAILESVTIRTAGGSEVRVKRLVARYGIRRLIAERRVEELLLYEPEVRLAGGKKEEMARPREPFRFPSLPIAVDRIHVENGAIADSAFRAEEIGLLGSIGRREGGAAVGIESLEGTLRIGPELRLPCKLEGSALLGPADDCSLAVAVEAAGTRLRHAGRLRVGGKLRGSGEVLLAPLDIDEALRLFAGRSGEEASLEGRIRYRGSPDSLALLVEGAGEARGIVFDSLRLRGSLAGSGLRVESLACRVGGARIEGEGILDIGEGGERSVALSFAHVDPGRFARSLAEGAESDINGSLMWEGSGAGVGDPDGKVVLRIERSSIRGLVIRDALVMGTVDREGLHVGESLLRTMGGEARFSGFAGWNGEVQGELAGSVSSIGELRAVAGIDSLSGAASFSVRVEGSRERMRAEGSLRVGGGQVGPVTFRELVFEGWAARDAQGITSLSGARVREGTVVGEAFDSLVAGLRVDRNALRLESVRLRRGTWEVAARGSLERDEKVDRLLLDRFTIRHGDTTIVAPDRVVLRKEKEGVLLEPVAFRFDGGRVEGEAARSEDGSLRARLSVRSADLGRLSEWLHVPAPLLSSIDLDAVYAESDASREAELSFRSHPPGEVDFPFRVVSGRATLTGPSVAIDSLVLLGLAEGARVRAEGVLRMDAPEEGMALSIRADKLPLRDLRFLTARLEEVEGSLDCEIRAAGSLGAPRLVASLTVDEASFRGYPLGSLRADTVWIGGDSLVFDLRFDSKRGETNRARGVLPVRIAPRKRELAFLPDAPMVVDLDIPRGDLRYVALLAGRGDDAIGEFALDGTLRGTLRDPRLGGSFEIRDALIFPAGVAFSFERTNARFLLDEDYVTVVGFEARSGERGRLNAWGRIDLEGFRPAGYDLAFRAQEYDAILADDVEMTFDADLVLRPDTTLFGRVVPHVAGEVTLRGALVSQEFGGEEGAPSVLDPTDSPDWTCDILVRAPRNLWVRNNLVDVELQGEAQVRRSDQGLGALGEFEVMRGSYYVYPNEFRVKSGTIVFPNPDDLRAAKIDITAETDVGGEKIEIRAYGGTEDVRVEPTSESGYTEGEILGMLALRARPEDEVSSGEVLSSWFRTFASRVSRQMSRGLGDIGTIEIGTSDELPELRYGNYVSSDLYLGFSQKIDAGLGRPEQERSPTREYLAIPEREVRVEYRLRRSLLVEGEVGTLRNGNRFLNLDLKVRARY